METQNTLQLKSITIDKFRCFDHYKINEIGSNATILIGRNGAGKTTLLNAIKMGLSFIFADAKEIKSITNGVRGVRIAQFNHLDGHYSWHKREYQYPLSIEMSGVYQDSSLPMWTLGKASESGGLLSTRYKEALLKFHKIYAKNKVLPLLAYYSDSYPHIGTRMSPYAKYMLKSGRPLPREFGYYQWDADTSCSEIWETRWLNAFQNFNSKYAEISNLENQIIAIKNQIIAENAKKYSDSEIIKQNVTAIADREKMILSYKTDAEIWNIEKEYIINIMKQFIAIDTDSIPITDIHIDYRANDAVIVLQYIDGSLRPFQQLPAGYKRLLSIVLDIAYRTFLLTRDKSEPSGIVLIDEIDLHLHPSLEQNVVERFKRTFPNIQFIITTHSPLVISNFKQDENNKIIVMNEENGSYSNYELNNQIGVDYSTIVRDAMGVKSSPNDIQTLVDDYLYLIEKKDSQRIEAFIQDISQKYNDSTAEMVKKLAENQIKLFQ